MKVILVRHGETEENKAGILQGHLHGTLSDFGKEQAEKLAERLKDEKIDLIVSSDLDRAHDTAKAIAKFHPEVELITDERLRERNLASLQGKVANDVDWNNLPEDVEIKEDVGNRILELFEDTVKENPDKTILFAAHAGVNRALIRRILEEANDGSVDWEEQGNTCVNIFEVNENGDVKIKLLNCTEHLE